MHYEAILLGYDSKIYLDESVLHFTFNPPFQPLNILEC